MINICSFLIRYSMLDVEFIFVATLVKSFRYLLDISKVLSNVSKVLSNILYLCIVCWCFVQSVGALYSLLGLCSVCWGFV